MGYSPFLREITLRKAFFLSITYLPFLCQQKIADVAVLDPVSAHVELIQRDNIFRVVITDVIICSKLTLDGFIGCQQIGNLNIQFFPAFVAYKVNFLVSGFAYCNFIVPAQKFQIKDTFESISGSVHLAQWGDTVPGTLQRRMDK